LSTEGKNNNNNNGQASLSVLSGDWVSALPIASCDLHLNNDVMRVSVAMRLGLNVCVPHA
jgi:hypothetical protein